MTHYVVGIVLVSIVAGAALWAEHYDSWSIKAPWTYVAGCAALFVPLSILWVVWGSYWEVVSLWVVSGVGGAVVIGLYHRDGKENQYRRLERENEELRTENAILKEEVIIWRRGGGQEK